MTANSNKRPKILLVDDHRDMLDALRRAFWKEPYDIETCDRADQALRMIEEHDIDVLVSDIEMPGMTGLELLSRVRQASPRTVRILVTGAGSVANTTAAINDGEVHRLLHKPFNPRELREVVASAIERLEELGNLSEASANVDRKHLLLEQLEHEYPGITAVDRDPDGVYVIDEVRAHHAASQCGLDCFFAPRTEFADF